MMRILLLFIVAIVEGRDALFPTNGRLETIVAPSFLPLVPNIPKKKREERDGEMPKEQRDRAMRFKRMNAFYITS